MSFYVFSNTKRVLTAACTIAHRFSQIQPMVKTISSCTNYRNSHADDKTEKSHSFPINNLKDTEQCGTAEKEVMSVEERLDHFNAFLETNPSNESIVAYYDKFGKDYDIAMKAATFVSSSQLCPKVRSRFPDTTLRILDVCAGTGAVGKELNTYGYLNIDALDGNATLLQIAKSAGVYANLYHEFIGTEALKSVQLDSYDLVICAGSIYPHHIEGRHLKAILSACKKGGYFAFTAYPAEDEDNTKVTDIVRQMEKEGFIRIEKYEIIPHTWWGEVNEQKFFILKKL